MEQIQEIGIEELERLSELAQALSYVQFLMVVIFLIIIFLFLFMTAMGWLLSRSIKNASISRESDSSIQIKTLAIMQNMDKSFKETTENYRKSVKVFERTSKMFYAYAKGNQKISKQILNSLRKIHQEQKILVAEVEIMKKTLGVEDGQK